MKHVTVLLTVLALMIATSPAAMAAKKKGKAKLGVFGTINGKSFKATSVDGLDDKCVHGIYDPGDGIVTFYAYECKAKRRRQGVAFKKNYKGMVISCNAFLQPGEALTVPFDIPCAGSVYEETRTGRFGVPVSTTQWLSNFDFTDPIHPTSNLRVRGDAFDGTNVRGALMGVFDTPANGVGTAPPVAISGEMTFDFPFEVR